MVDVWHSRQFVPEKIKSSLRDRSHFACFLQRINRNPLSTTRSFSSTVLAKIDGRVEQVDI